MTSTVENLNRTYLLTGGSSRISRKRFEPSDVLFGKLRPYLAKVVRPNAHGLCVGEFLVLRPNSIKFNAGFLEQLLRSRSVIDIIDSSTFGAKMPRAEWNFIGGMSIVRPPLPEQIAIVRFLDHADRRIQRYIHAKEKMIALLEEQKQAIVHQAVTGRIDVRTGRPYPAYKPSGVEWLGDIPAHWSLAPNKEMLRPRKFLVGEMYKEYELLSLTKAGIIVRDISAGRGKFSADMGTSQEVRSGDLVFCLFDVPETPRTVGLSQYDGMITGAYTVFECGGSVLRRYLEAFYILLILELPPVRRYVLFRFSTVEVTEWA